MQCGNCDKYFVFQTSISFYYEPSKADCLNDGKHDYQLTKTYPSEFSEMQCAICEHRRDLTDQERKAFNIGSKESLRNQF